MTGYCGLEQGFISQCGQLAALFLNLLSVNQMVSRYGDKLFPTSSCEPRLMAKDQRAAYNGLSARENRVPEHRWADNK